VKYLSQIIAIARKDILSEIRTREVFSSVLVFAVLVLVVFYFAFDPDREMIVKIAPGILWVAFVFAGVLALNRAFIMEKEDNCLEGLLCCPAEREAIFIGKALGSLFFMLIIEAVVLVVFLVLYNVSMFRLELIVVTILTTIGFVSVGTLFSALAVNTRAREMVLPILFLPIVTPIIIAAVQSSATVLNGGSWAAVSNWLWLLVAFDVVFAVVSFLVFPFVIEE